jgi:hypothetical protein
MELDCWIVVASAAWKERGLTAEEEELLILARGRIARPWTAERADGPAYTMQAREK